MTGGGAAASRSRAASASGMGESQTSQVASLGSLRNVHASHHHLAGAGAAARATAARILAARRAVVVRKCVETAVPEEIAGVVASFLARWG